MAKKTKIRKEDEEIRRAMKRKREMKRKAAQKRAEGPKTPKARKPRKTGLSMLAG